MLRGLSFESPVTGFELDEPTIYEVGMQSFVVVELMM
jgi:hypothetical protein